MKRTDTHRPSEIKPEEYRYVAPEVLRIEGPGDIAYVQHCREVIQKDMERTGGTYSQHAHGGNCMVCGNVHAIYTILFHHEPTNTYIRMGETCARKVEMGYVPAELNTLRKAVKDAREFQAGKQKAQALLQDAGLEICWEIHLAYQEAEQAWWKKVREEEDKWNEAGCPDDWEWARHDYKKERGPGYGSKATISDIVQSVIKYGHLSEKQISYLKILLDKINTAEEREEQREEERKNAKPAPEGRMEITGVVLGTRTDEGYYGKTWKMLVQHADGWKLWTTVPLGLCPFEKGDEVTFTVTVKQSKDDPTFALGKRPHAKKGPRDRHGKLYTEQEA